MRLDLFLKHSRLVVRRPVAQAMCDAGAVMVNGSVGKPGRSVAVGDTLQIRQRGRLTTVRILTVPARPPSKAQSVELYELLNIADDPDADPLSGA